MSFVERARLESKISYLYNEASRLEDDRLKAELAKFICVLASGHLEIACRQILTNYTMARSHPNVARYVQRRLDKFLNPKVGKIINLIQDFDPDKSNQLQTFLDGRLGASIDSIVSNRNNIAHGRDVGIGLVTIKGYHDDARKAVGKLEALFPSTT